MLTPRVFPDVKLDNRTIVCEKCNSKSFEVVELTGVSQDKRVYHTHLYCSNCEWLYCYGTWSNKTEEEKTYER